MNWRHYIGHLVFGGSAGGAMFLVYELFSTKPEMVIDTFRSWGPLFALCLVGLALVDRGFNNMVAAARESSAAQQKLADAVNQIAQKDDERQREMELVVGQLARNSRQVLDEMRDLKQQLFEGKANAHSAG